MTSIKIFLRKMQAKYECQLVFTYIRPYLFIRFFFSPRLGSKTKGKYVMLFRIVESIIKSKFRFVSKDTIIEAEKLSVA